ncbi:MAG: LptF/LptG family permease [Parachlamydiales bacterium]|jgi:lipopolysaccharide export system permease protein
MPLFWRYLTYAYWKVFLLSTFGFICVLLITRLKEIARFAALATGLEKILLYTLYQIPHILPIALPISCLISALLLFQRFSKTQELTALRASGFSLKKISLPILASAFLISFFNFYIASETTPRCINASKKIAHSQISLNPIFLLEKPKLLKIKKAFVDLETSPDSNSAKNLIFITPNKYHSKLFLMKAEKLSLEDGILIGSNVALISHIETPNHFDTLIVENQKLMKTEARKITKIMKSESFPLNSLHLPTKMLLIRAEKESAAKKQTLYLEIIRRLAISFSAFSFTFIGIAYGIQISRIESKKKLFIAVLFALFILVSFIGAKALKGHPFSSALIYILVQPVILFFSTRSIRRTSAGLL